jgi:hypothetical protein
VCVTPHVPQVESHWPGSIRAMDHLRHPQRQAKWASCRRTLGDDREEHFFDGLQPRGNLDRVPGALKDLFKFALDGSVKVEITMYPLVDASIAHSAFEGRKSTGKLVLVP